MSLEVGGGWKRVYDLKNISRDKSLIIWWAIFSFCQDGYFVTLQKLWKYGGKKNVISKTISKQLSWTLSFFRSMREQGFWRIKLKVLQAAM